MSVASANAPMLERERELHELDQVLDGAAAGAGGVVLVEGVAGIGKTRLLDAAAERAGARDFRVLRARGTELEREFAFGIVRQLFDRLVRSADDRERRSLLADAAGLCGPLFGSRIDGPEGQLEPGFPALHGLYWLLANLSEGGPVALIVDDAQWADGASLRYLGFIAARLSELPAVAVVAARPGRVELPFDRDVRTLRPAALSVAGVKELVDSELRSPADPEFARACHATVGGNPFYLHQLVLALRRAETQPDAAAAAQIAGLGPSAVARAALARMSELAPGAPALARALAVLGDGAEPGLVARLAELDPGEAAAVADGLVHAEILERGERMAFVHPIVRNAVYEHVTPRLRAELHRRAARALGEDGASPERVAAQLLASDCLGDPWAVGVLRDAGRDALGRGTPDAAASYLARAVAEPPHPDDRAATLHALATAEALARSPAAVEHLRAALEAAADPRSRAQITLALSFELAMGGDGAVATGMLEEAIGALEANDRALRLQLEAMLAAVARNEFATHRKSRDRLLGLEPELSSDGPPERALLANLAFNEIFAGAPASRGAELAERALAGGRLLDEQTSDGFPLYFAINTLWMAERYDAAEANFAAALEDARRRGSSLGFALASCFRAEVGLARGALIEAEADARAARGAFGDQDGALLISANACLARIAVERGDWLTAEEAVSGAPSARDGPPAWHLYWLMEARGRLRLAQGRPEEALEDLVECERRAAAWGVRNPPYVAWQQPAVLAHVALGNVASAAAHAVDGVATARRFGAPRALGVALTVAGLAAADDSGEELLTEAVAVLKPSPARLDYARACTELGAYLRRHRRRTEAREPLRTGLDIAERCGAKPLAERARTELAATGARPRRALLTGVESLTPSELRVARMAASGMTNRQIAQALFVTVKTVEVHLSHAYAKLDIQLRSQLEAALAAD